MSCRALTPLDPQLLTHPSQNMCIGNMNDKASELGCKSGDMECLCKSDDYKYGIRDCTTQACPGEDAQAVVQNAVSKCPGGKIGGSDGDDDSDSTTTGSGSDSTETAAPSGTDSAGAGGSDSSATATGSSATGTDASGSETGSSGGASATGTDASGSVRV